MKRLVVMLRRPVKAAVETICANDGVRARDVLGRALELYLVQRGFPGLQGPRL